MSAAPTAMRAALAALARGEDLGRELAADSMREIMAGLCEPALIGAWLMGLATKGERLDEIVGAATAMREAVVAVPTSRADVLDTCGTGGSGIARRNVSTAVAIAVAACGHPVAKHGNRSSNTPSGSADVLEALGYDLAVPAADVGAMIDEIGIGFCFAPALHPAMKHAAPVRRALGIRTLFNLLGPLCNPASATRQVLGVFDPRHTRDLAGALGRLGSVRVLAIHGYAADVAPGPDAPWGIDDVSTEGITEIWQWHRGQLGHHLVTPADAGLAPVPTTALAGDRPQDNAEALLRLFEGEPGPYRTAVQLAGALALVAAGDDDLGALPAAAQRIGAVLDDGRARSVLADLVARSHDRPRTRP